MSTFFRPTISTVRNPKNEGMKPVINGNIINPPRFSQIGGFTSGNARGTNDTWGEFRRTVPPGATTRKVPFSK
jgi:hypothetical protein